MSLESSQQKESNDLAAWVFEHFSGCIREVSCNQIQYSALGTSSVPKKVEECIELLRSQGGEMTLAVLSPAVVVGLQGSWALLTDIDLRVSLNMGGSAVFVDPRAMITEEAPNLYIVELQGLMGG